MTIKQRFALVAFIIFSIFLISVFIFLKNGTKNIELKTKEIKIYYGESINLDSDDIKLVKTNYLGKEKNINIRIDWITYDKEYIGTQNAVLKYKEEIYNFQITIEKINLESPSIKNVDGLISWDKVKDADTYEISINNTIYETSSNSYDITKELLASRELIIKVRSKSKILKYNISEFSNELKITKLEDVGTIIYENGLIIWDDVPKATSYIIKINGMSKTVYENKYEFNNFNDGENKITVIAFANLSQIISSEESTLVITKKHPVYNIRFENNKIVWDHDSIGGKYRIEFDGSVYEKTEKYIDVEIETNREYVVKITVIAEENNEVKSDTIIETILKNRLSKPTGSLNFTNYNYQLELKIKPPYSSDKIKVIIFSYQGDEVSETELEFNTETDISHKITYNNKITKIKIHVEAIDTSGTHENSDVLVLEKNT